MKLPQLVDYLLKQPEQRFFIFGRYGYVRATPQTTNGGQVIYTIDSTYIDSQTSHQMHSQRGFRLSTICCLCAGVLFGEQVLDNAMISLINSQF